MKRTCSSQDFARPRPLNGEAARCLFSPSKTNSGLGGAGIDDIIAAICRSSNFRSSEILRTKCQNVERLLALILQQAILPLNKQTFSTGVARQCRAPVAAVFST